MRMLNEEPIEFFKDFITKAKFRRVMYGEYFDGHLMANKSI